LTVAEFCKACRNLGIEGEFRSIFESIHDDGSGLITMGEFAPKAYKTLRAFAKLLQDKYGTLDRAWRLGLARNSPGGLSKALFLEGCLRVGFDGDPFKLLSYLNMEEFGTGRITMDDLDFLGLLREKEKYRVALNLKDCVVARVSKPRAQTLADMKRVMEERYGSVPVAWRRAIDAGGEGRLTLGEFCSACRECGIEGNLRAIFRELDAAGQGTVSLQEFDPAAFGILNEFADCLQTRYKTLDKAWNYGLATGCPGGLTRKQIIEGCLRVGFHGDVDKLVNCLDADPDAASFRITMGELGFLGLPRDTDYSHDVQPSWKREAQQRAHAAARNRTLRRKKGANLDVQLAAEHLGL